MTDPSQTPARLLEIEHELSSPDADAALARHDAVLAALDARISNALASGLPPDEFARTEELGKANLIARKILRLAVRDARMSSSS